MARIVCIDEKRAAGSSRSETPPTAYQHHIEMRDQQVGSAKPHEQSDSNIGISSSDLDNLRRSEAKCRALITHANEVILIFDATGIVTYCSAAIHTVLGYTEGEIVGKSHFDLVHAEDYHGVREAFESLVRSPRRQRDATFRVRSKGGEWRQMAADAVNLLDEPAVEGMVIALRDVTETRAMEHQLRHVQKMDALGRLAAGIAHDYNNLLTIILNYVELMATARDLAEVANTATELRGTAFRAAGLSRQLIAFSQRHPVHPQNVDLNAVVSGVYRLLHRVIGERIDFSCDLEPRLPSIRADVGHLEQVLVNLAVNARDAMSSGGKLVISTKSIVGGSRRDTPAPPDLWVRLSVRDTGMGMTDETRSRLFEPFFSTKPPGHGSGLGLATVYGIVAQTGGHINVSSVPGRGTTFDIFFPALGGDAATTPVGAPTRHSVGGTETLILIEDDASVRRSIARMLSNAGYTVIERSGSPDEPVTQDELAQADLLIVDEALAVTSGHELVDALRKMRPTLLTLYMSGYDPSPALLRALEQGISEFISKPFDAATLRDRIRAMLDRTG